MFQQFYGMQILFIFTDLYGQNKPMEMAWPCPKNARSKNPKASIALEASGPEEGRKTERHMAANDSKRHCYKVLDQADVEALAEDIATGALDQADVEALAEDRGAGRRFAADLWAI